MTDDNKRHGYVSLYRSIKNHWVWEDPIKLKWWLTLLLEVNHTDKKCPIGNTLINCNRGQTIKSLKNLSIIWNTSRDSARNFLVMLEKDKMITRENLKKTTRITICNFESYQSSLHNSQTLSKRNPNDDQTLSDTNNKGNKGNKGNNENNVNKSAPSLEEVKQFFKENLYMVETGEKAYHYYNDNNWLNSKGKEVKNWKSTMRNNWFKKENQSHLHPQKYKIDL